MHIPEPMGDLNAIKNQNNPDGAIKSESIEITATKHVVSSAQYAASILSSVFNAKY